MASKKSGNALNWVFGQHEAIHRDNVLASPLVRDAFALTSDTVDLSVGLLSGAASDDSKGEAIRELIVSSTSPLIVAIRLSLSGNLPESLTVLRTALEVAVQLRYVVKARMYETYLLELERKFAKVSYKTSVAELGSSVKKLNMLHGVLSDVAAHATSKRSRWNRYEHGEELFLRIGFSRDVEEAELGLFYCMNVALQIPDAIIEALSEECDTADWKKRLDGLLGRYKSLKAKFMEKKPDWFCLPE